MKIGHSFLKPGSYLWPLKPENAGMGTVSVGLGKDRGVRLALSTAAMVIGATFALLGEGQAALISCPASFTADGTARVFNGTSSAASACQYISPADNNNVASVANVNAAGFFGFSDWSGNGGQVQLEGAGNAGGSGTWSIVGVDFASFDYMITFKDGNGTNLISFLLNEAFSSGDWNTPFTEPPFDFNGASESHNVSHLSIFQRQAQQVPEPVSLLLFGVGFLGLGFLASRRRIAA